MPKMKLPKELTEATNLYAKLSRKAKDASNEANRQKTVLRNTVKNHWQKEQLPVGSYIHAGGLRIRFETNETSAINPERVLELYENEEISRDQLLNMMKIGVTEAKNILGGDQVADFTEKVPGTKMDIRLEELPVENVEDEFVMSAHKVKKRISRRKIYGRGDKAKETGPRTKSGKLVRKIRTKK